MRHETQPYDQVRATLEVVSAGVGQSGLTPTVAIRRLSDNQWLQSGGASWGASFATNNMNELDSTNMPGLYQYDVGDSVLEAVAGADGYALLLVEPDAGIREHVLVSILPAIDASTVADAVWNEALNDHTGAGSTGRALAVVQGLTQGNHRISNPTYDADGRLLSCELVVYPTSTDALNETSPIATFNVTSTYDGDGNLATLLSRE